MKVYKFISISIIIVFLCLDVSVFAQNSAKFQEANELYGQGEFELAIDTYQSILQTGEHSAELYFNLANSHYKLNNVASSIYFYEKALQLNPTDKDVQNNLAFAQKMTIDAIEEVPEVGFDKLYKNWVNAYSFDSWSRFAVAFSVAFVILFIIYYFSQNTTKKRLTFILGFICVFASLSTLFMAFNKFDFDQKNIAAVVFDKSIEIKSEPNAESSNLFKLHEGTKIKVLDSVSKWHRIELPDGLTGWIPSNAIKVL